jgi:hypothetical protein
MYPSEIDLSLHIIYVDQLLRNKLMSKRKKSSRLGYLPVQSLEADTPDSPALSPGRAVTRQV